MFFQRFALAAAELNGALYAVGGYDENYYLRYFIFKAFLMWKRREYPSYYYVEILLCLQDCWKIWSQRTFLEENSEHEFSEGMPFYGCFEWKIVRLLIFFSPVKCVLMQQCFTFFMIYATKWVFYTKCATCFVLGQKDVTFC